MLQTLPKAMSKATILMVNKPPAQSSSENGKSSTVFLNNGISGEDIAELILDTVRRDGYVENLSATTPDEINHPPQTWEFHITPPPSLSTTQFGSVHPSHDSDPVFNLLNMISEQVREIHEQNEDVKQSFVTFNERLADIEGALLRVDRKLDTILS